jgi:HD-like signal output (HDOD) protein
VLRQVVLMAEVFHESDAIGLLETVQHRALIRSKLARLIAAQAPVATLAAEAALLADLGVYLLALRRPDSYRPLWETYAKGEAPLQQLEQAAMSSTHAEVGAALLGLWNLPPTIVAAVAHHHVPPEKPLTLDTRTIVNLAALLEDEAVLQGPARAEATAELQRIAGALSLSDRLHALRDVAATCRSGESGVSKPEGVPS